MNICKMCGARYDGLFCPECGTRAYDEERQSSHSGNTNNQSHVCPRCGVRYEGRFCPECGEKWIESKQCPQCGMILKGNTKFCNQCGYAFGNSYSRGYGRPNNSNGILVLYKCIRFLPEILFILLSLLMFAFMAAPVFDLFGYGENVYTLMGEEGMKGAMISLMVFAAAGIVCAILIAITWWKKKSSARIILTYIGYGFYLAYLVFGCVFAAEAGQNMVNVGACPILLIVFSIIFALLSIVSIILCNKLVTNEAVARYISVLDREEEQENKKVMAQKAAIKEKKTAEYKESQYKNFVRLRRVVYCLAILCISCILVDILGAIIYGYYYTSWIYEIRPFWMLGLGILFGIIISIVLAKDVDVTKRKGENGNKRLLMTCLILSIISLLLFLIELINFHYFDYYVRLVSGIKFVIGIISVILSIIALIKRDNLFTKTPKKKNEE